MRFTLRSSKGFNFVVDGEINERVIHEAFNGLAIHMNTYSNKKEEIIVFCSLTGNGTTFDVVETFIVGEIWAQRNKEMNELKGRRIKKVVIDTIKKIIADTFIQRISKKIDDMEKLEELAKSEILKKDTKQTIWQLVDELDENLKTLVEKFIFETRTKIIEKQNVNLKEFTNAETFNPSKQTKE